MSVEEIPSNELVVMTDFLHRAFNAGGCDPTCHCCNKNIPAGDNFKLSTVEDTFNYWGYNAYFQKEVLLGNKKPTVKDYMAYNEEEIRPEYKASDTKKMKETAKEYEMETKEVMLCEDCSPETFKQKKLSQINLTIERLEKPKGGCYRVNGKIVI